MNIRATCPNCGDVVLPREAMQVRICADDRSGAYNFTCPQCRTAVAKNDRKPIKTWVVPEEGDSQEFKNKILKESFTPEELAHRDEFIKTLGVVTNSPWTKFLVWLQKLVKNSSGKR